MKVGKNMNNINVYTCKYLNETYGYSFNHDEIIAINNGDDETPYILVINNDKSLHVYGAKQSMVLNDVSVACKQVGLSCVYWCVVSRIQRIINHIERIEKMCKTCDISFNDN